MGVLEVKNLCIGYENKGQTKVIQKDINLSLERGQIISLMGQNGVGKTTFIKTISGLLDQLSGEIVYNGKSITRLSKLELARQLSVVLTEKPYSQNLSVLELIAIGRHPYSGWMGTLSEHDKKIIDWAISETHINYLANRKIYELSDGQLQKVMIARALAQETDIILLDEPAAHLDLYNKIEVMVLLRDIARKGKAILISTHDMQVSTQLSDKLWLFNFNQSVIQGSPEDLILDGTLEKTLYLQDYGYDMIHGTVDLAQNGIEIHVSGNENEVYWTEQALKRNGYRLTSEAEVSVTVKNRNWQLIVGQQTFDLKSIAELISKLSKMGLSQEV
ncbi:MAG: ATP-binding protein [Flammeovirgaceae bacterium]|nr:ATP-binding protein [Flammeovirgaceae bacterium]MBE63100.1 ATP-binding protein [Flammeovirgaceae bacterium]MBR09237.1 ATP-binding protein [Rickettsiales bacterium]|tara:strand:- start:4489 stop:5484 length:996 start_codon:yes stop_codon:yes gene_type:complete